MSVILPEISASGATPPTERVERCFLCGDSATEPVLVPSRDRLHRLPGRWALVRCTGCGLARLNPRPVLSDIGFYYPSEYCSFHGPPQGGGDPVDAAGAGSVVRSAKAHLRNAVLAYHGYETLAALPRPLRWIAPVASRAFKRRVFVGAGGFPHAPDGDGRALDVGCGAGALLRLLQHHGWDVAGVELDPEAADVARATTGREVFAGEIQDAPFEPESFDFVHMSHVIEHMGDPAASLAAAYRLLRPGGQLYIETPNLESWNAARQGTHWIGYDSPRHLYLFSPSTLRRLVGEHGFSIEALRTWGFPGVFLWEDTYRVEDEVGGLLEAEERPRIRRSRVPRAAVLAARARLARVRRNRGDIMGLWARRPAGARA